MSFIEVDLSGYETALTDTEQPIEPAKCKICLEEVTGDKERSFRPCKCNYSVCHKCLEDWIKYSENKSCEICRTEYIITYQNVIGLSKCADWFRRNRTIIFLLLLIAIVPFLGDNGSNLSEYFYSEEEDRCTKSGIHPFIMLTPMGCFISVMMVTVIFVAAIVVGISKERRTHFLDKKRNIVIAASAIVLCHVIFYIIGNFLYFYVQTPIHFDDKRCSQYNQIQIERYEWMTPVNISLVTWFLGALTTIFTILAVYGAILSVCLVVIIFMGLYALGKYLVNLLRRIIKNGFCATCCPCCIQQRLVIGDINSGSNL